jgi:hypothetical protein
MCDDIHFNIILAFYLGKCNRYLLIGCIHGSMVITSLLYQMYWLKFWVLSIRMMIEQRHAICSGFRFWVHRLLVACNSVYENIYMPDCSMETDLWMRLCVMKRRGRSRKQLLVDIKETGGHWILKEEALDRTVWRTCFESCCGPVVRQNTE